MLKIPTLKFDDFISGGPDGRLCTSSEDIAGLYGLPHAIVFNACRALSQLTGDRVDRFVTLELGAEANGGASFRVNRDGFGLVAGMLKRKRDGLVIAYLNAFRAMEAWLLVQRCGVRSVSSGAVATVIPKS